MDSLKETIRRKVDELRDEAVGLFQDLVRIPSFNPPGNEKEVADFCAEIMRKLGMEVDQIEPHPLRVSNRGRLRGSEGTPVLLFNSHLDTVHPGDELNWTHPPLSGEIHDGHLWGIGSNNMKVGLAAAMFAVRTLKACGVKLRGDILLTQTADELQFGYKGIKVMVEQGMIEADYGVYTESDRPVKVEIGHRGIVLFDVTVYGVGAHTTRQEKGVNAIYQAMKAVEALRRMEFTGWAPHAFVPGAPLLSVNRFNAGFSDTICADRCVIRCDCRTLPGQTTDNVLTDVRAVLDRLRAEDPDFRADLSVHIEGSPSTIHPDEPIVQALQRAYEEVRKEPIGIGGVMSTSDARFLRVEAGIPTAKFCLKSFDSGPNEHQNLEDYIDTIKIYATLCLNLLT